MATMSATLLMVIVATYVGYSMLTADGGERQANDPVQLAAWVENATETCLRVAEEHPVLTQGTEARGDSDNIGAVAAGVAALDAGIRDLPRLIEEGDQKKVTAVTKLGKPARTAWKELADSGDAAEGAIGKASKATTAYVSGLVDLGADCGVLD